MRLLRRAAAHNLGQLLSGQPLEPLDCGRIRDGEVVRISLLLGWLGLVLKQTGGNL